MRVSLVGVVDRRLAGERVELLVGAGGRLRGRARRATVPAGAQQGIVTIATRGDLRYHAQGISARLQG